MGAAPGPSPSTVATQFARVYYRVSSKIPSRLAEFYGDVSEFDHGPGLRASGRDAISQLAEKLPLVNVRTELTSVLGQPSANGTVLVVVSGTYGTACIDFMQTFVLAKQTDSHDEHFFCRNDVFVHRSSGRSPQQPTSDDSKTETSPVDPPAEPVSPPKPHTTRTLHADSPVRPLASTHASIPSATAQTGLRTQTATMDSDVNGLSEEASTLAPTHADSIAEGISSVVATAQAHTQDARHLPHAAMNTPSVLQRGSPAPSPTSQVDQRDPASDVSPVVSGGSTSVPGATATSVSTASTLTTEVAVPLATIPSVGDRRDGADGSSAHAAQAGNTSLLGSHLQAEVVPVTTATEENKRAFSRPAASVKKTWASIVSSNEEHATSSTAGSTGMSSSPPSGALLNSVPSATSPRSNASLSVSAAPEESVSVDVKKADSVAVTTTGTAAVNTSNTMEKHGFHGGHSTMGRGGPMNGRGMHHMGRGPPRVFGPSAVVTLASTGMQTSDVRTLTNNLREEFGRYGHRLRGVEVKASKGIAFIEYETAEGVRAAVDAWAHGPRQDGGFSGVALHVTEKRVAPMGRRGGGMRGNGRGGPRGGARRARPPSASMSASMG